MREKEIDWLGDLFEDLFNYPVSKIIQGFKQKKVENGYEYEVVLPGLSKEDMDLNLKMEENQHVMTLNLKKESVFYPAGERSFVLPKDIDTETISSNIKDGVLTIKMSKSKENVKEIKIAIN